MLETLVLLLLLLLRESFGRDCKTTQKMPRKKKKHFNHVFRDSKHVPQSASTSYQNKLKYSLKTSTSFKTAGQAKGQVQASELPSRSRNHGILIVKGDQRLDFSKSSASSLYPVVEKMTKKFQGKMVSMHENTIVARNSLSSSSGSF